MKDARAEYVMIRYEGGLVVTCDEGIVTVSIEGDEPDDGRRLMWLTEIDAGIEQYERELAEGYEGEAPPIGVGGHNA